MKSWEMLLYVFPPESKQQMDDEGCGPVFAAWEELAWKDVVRRDEEWQRKLAKEARKL